MRRAFLALLLASPAYAQTYEPVLLPPVITASPQTTTPLNLGDDNAVQLSLGFDFPYWGQTFSSAWVSSNGTISFSTSSNLCCNGQPLEQAPRNTIYGFWTDLISGGNPYYRRDDGSFLVGWYGTNEYGSNIQQTFEVNLFSSGDIQFNFGNLGLQWHTATVGITGPEAGDNVQLFYGTNPQPMRNQSGVLKWGGQPVAQVDCNITPLDPSCPPQMVAPVDVVTAPAIVTIQDAYVEDTAADQAELAAATVPEPEQEVVVAAAEETASSITEQVAEAIAAETTTAAATVAAASAEPQAERLSPEQVAALAASGPAQDSQQVMQDAPVFLASAGPTAQFGASALSGGGFVTQGPSAGFSGGNGADVSVAAGGGSSSPSSVANTIEVLNMSGGSFAASAAPGQGGDQQGGQGGNPDAEKMEAMASVPGFSAYAQVALQDRPDFYVVRDIYKNRRIRDANFEMYRMTQSNNAKWQEMVDVQYRQ